MKFTTQSEDEVFNVVACEVIKEGTYCGMFAVNYDVDCQKVASEIVEWGRRRWTIESSFDVEKNNGYGLEHVFCNHWRCSRNFYLLMQLANNLWQMFNACVIPKLSEGCRKMAQFEWVELLFRAFHDIGITVEFALIPRRYVRRMNL